MRIIPGTGHNDRLLLRITNTSGATKQVTIAKSTSSQVNTDQVTSPTLGLFPPIRWTHATVPVGLSFAT